ncbi:MAG: YiiX family permuted papain-like enzyme [Spirochaetota bacterium]
MRFAVLVLTLLAPLAAFAPDRPEDRLRDGDLIFQETASAQSKAIQLATHSRYSHVGIIYFRNGRPFVLEAVQPVKISSLSSFIGRSVGGHYVVKRLKNAGTILTKPVLAKMQRIGRSFVGKNYDWVFGWSDARIYCSELVWKIYQRAAGIELSPTKKLREFDLSHPVVRAKMKERYGKKIPLDEPVVAPSQLFESPLLETIDEK